MNCVNQCHGDVLSALAHRLHEPHDAENLHREAAEKGTGEVREWIGQIIMITQVYGNRLTILTLTRQKGTITIHLTAHYPL